MGPGQSAWREVIGMDGGFSIGLVSAPVSPLISAPASAPIAAPIAAPGSALILGTLPEAGAEAGFLDALNRNLLPTLPTNLPGGQAAGMPRPATPSPLSLVQPTPVSPMLASIPPTSGSASSTAPEVLPGEASLLTAITASPVLDPPPAPAHLPAPSLVRTSIQEGAARYAVPPGIPALLTAAVTGEIQEGPSSPPDAEASVAFPLATPLAAELPPVTSRLSGVVQPALVPNHPPSLAEPLAAAETGPPVSEEPSVSGDLPSPAPAADRPEPKPESETVSIEPSDWPPADRQLAAGMAPFPAMPPLIQAVAQPDLSVQQAEPASWPTAGEPVVMVTPAGAQPGAHAALAAARPEATERVVAIAAATAQASLQPATLASLPNGLEPPVAMPAEAPPLVTPRPQAAAAVEGKPAPKSSVPTEPISATLPQPEAAFPVPDPTHDRAAADLMTSPPAEGTAREPRASSPSLPAGASQPAATMPSVFLSWGFDPLAPLPIQSMEIAPPRSAPPPAPPPAPMRQIAPIAIALAFTPGVANGFQLSLEPAELGRVEIRVQRDGDTHSVRVMAERPETLALLLRDRQELDRSLADAGLRVDSKGIDFSLGPQSGQPDQRQHAEARSGQARPGQAHEGRGNGTGQPAAEHPPTRAQRGLLDLNI